MTDAPHATGRNASAKKIVPLVVVIVCCVVSVPCVGVLAAIAIPSFIGYVREAKVAEARTNVVVLGNAVRDYCARTGHLPPPAGPVPAIATSEKQLGSFGADPVFAELGFAPADPVYYSYSIVAGPDGSVAVHAEGDLDGDGVLSRFAVTCYGSCECYEVPPRDELE